MKKPQAAKAAGVKPAKPKTSAGKPRPKKPPPKHHVHVPAATRVKRHAAAVKAAKTRAVNAKKAKAHPRRKLALGSAVACCSAEALAASLRLTGWPVSDQDVLALYRHTARDDDAGASIVATLEAAAEFGLAGVRLTSYDLTETYVPDRSQAGLILGLSLPAPHAVLDTGSEWVSWGEPWPAWAFPGAVAEEAWMVCWEAS